MNKYALILAGGKGERFWPWSRRELPKQFLTLTGKRSLIQQTWDRLQEIFPAENILVATGDDYVPLVSKQLPHLTPANILVEPVGRNTAPCIGLAALRLHKADPQSTMLVLPADHLVRKQDAFQHSLQQCLKLAAENDSLITIGITPSRPETGYGYIEINKKRRDGKPGSYKVNRFVEKPDRQKAAQFLAAGNFFWNSGIFAWKTALILNKIREYLPALAQGLQEMAPSLGTPAEKETLARLFPTLPSISIDYGVLEKDRDTLMVQGDFDWDDLGSWTALAKQFSTAGQKNVSKGRHLGLATENCLVYAQDALVATLGVSDLVIVQTEDVVLVCSMERAQEVKELVEKLKTEGLEQYL
ncbi:MAG: NTP transferase domain-containing protein [Firmicutes bacterium]|nr:NTP transferase domain-containing protein [Bacillota bacterium]